MRLHPRMTYESPPGYLRVSPFPLRELVSVFNRRGRIILIYSRIQDHRLTDDYELFEARRGEWEARAGTPYDPLTNLAEAAFRSVTCPRCNEKFSARKINSPLRRILRLKYLHDGQPSCRRKEQVSA